MDITNNDYWGKLTPRQRLADCVHKIAQNSPRSYPESWQFFERVYDEYFGGRVWLRKKKFSPRQKISLPEYLEKSGELPQALALAVDLVKNVTR